MERFSNKAYLKGEISNPTFLLQTKMGKNIYEATIRVKRKSGTIDSIPIRLSEDLLESISDESRFVCINGYFQSLTIENKLILYVWVKNLFPLEKEEYDNNVIISGYICKTNPLRETPLSKKTLLDFMVAFNSVANAKSYYFPIIAWNSTARYVSKLSVGSHVYLSGRIQSREYIKQNEKGTSEVKTAYEITTLFIDY